MRPTRVAPPLIGAVGVAALAAWMPSPQAAPQGYAIESQTVIDRCSRCHTVDEGGRMSRISYLRKTPEGWQTSIRRMVALHGARLSAEEAREIVRYLADEQGLAPEELRPGSFEVERRMIDHDYEGDSGVEFTCIQCHSMGRVITQRRTKEEWGLLLDTHRALYPLVDGQAFRRSGPPDEGEDPRQPMDAAIDHLSEVFPLATPEWAAWAATKRSPRLDGSWALTGYEPGKGPLYGRVSISRSPSDDAAFSMTGSYVYPETGERVTRTGEAIVYTGYQWRGRSNPGTDSELREVMFIERDLRTMSGRWFAGAYDETGPDVRLIRMAGDPVLAGVFPTALERGRTTTVTLYGSGLPIGDTGELLMDFGEGVTIEGIDDTTDASLTLRLRATDEAGVGGRDLHAFGVVLESAVVVHDGVDWIEVTPETGMARIGGAAFPKGLQTFDAIAYDRGPDGEPDTADDLALGRVAVEWSLEEYAAVLGDEDIAYVGTIGQDGTFIPALDGPNPDRIGNRNNVGDVWVVARYRPGAGVELSARAHLVVSVPLYMRFEPWRDVDAPRAATFQDDR